MDRTPAPDPYPAAQPVPAPPARSDHNPAVVLFGVGGLMVLVGGLLPRAELSVGPIGVVQTKGIAIGLVIIGALMVLRAFQVFSRGSGRGGAPILFGGSVVALGLVIYDFATAKSDLSHWATTTGAQQLATQFKVPVSLVSSRIQALLDSGQTHVTYKVGLWVALLGALLSLAAAIWAWMTGRGAGQAAAGPGWVAPAPAPAGTGVPLAPGSPAPGAPPAPGSPAPTDWTAPPSDWTAPPPSSAPPAQPAAPAQPGTPAPAPPSPGETAEEPESFPPPPPPPPS